MADLVKKSPVPPLRRVDFRLTKLNVTLAISAVGLAVALLWHGFQGWGLGRGYPYNTFLFEPSARLTDFFVIQVAAAHPTPYAVAILKETTIPYPPFIFAFMRLFGIDHPLAGAVVFFGSTSFGLLCLLLAGLRSFIPDARSRLGYALALLATSYPWLYCLDRGNLEMLVVVLVGAVALFFLQRHWAAGVACLIAAICLKMYPVLLVFVLIRRRQWLWIPLAGVVSLAISVASMASFSGSLASNWALWRQSTGMFYQTMVIHTTPIDQASGPWNMVKALTILATYIFSGGTISEGAPLEHVVGLVLNIYTFVTVVLLILTAFHVMLIERELARRLVIILLYMTVAAPGGADYKMLHAEIGLFLLIIIKSRRHHDLLAIILLALAFIPKREILLPSLLGGLLPATDTGASITIYLSPLLLMAAGVLLVRDGWTERLPGWGWQRARGLWNLRHLPFLKLPPSASVSL